jgi:N-acetylglucosamine-6-phosphate deacetylase
MDGTTRSLVIRNGSVLLGNGQLETCDVLLAQGRIAALGHGLAADAVLDVGGAFVLPGLIYLHTHGIGRESMASAALEGYARLEAAHGATAFFPTLFGPPLENIGHMQRHREHDPAHAGAQVAGFRLESPYLAHTGAGLSRDLTPITAETTEALLAAGGGRVKIWDISPELPAPPSWSGASRQTASFAAWPTRRRASSRRAPSWTPAPGW